MNRSRTTPNVSPNRPASSPNATPLSPKPDAAIRKMLRRTPTARIQIQGQPHFALNTRRLAA